jgi:hypothetical protein
MIIRKPASRKPPKTSAQRTPGRAGRTEGVEGSVSAVTKPI